MTVGLLSFGSLLQLFNNGKSQTQSWDLSYGGDFPFVNFMKTAVGWSYNDNSGNLGADALDTNGYPLAPITRGGFKTICNIYPLNSGLTGTYVLRWKGNGTMGLTIANDGTVTSTGVGSLTSTTGIGRYEFTTTAFNGLVVGINALTGPGSITDVEVIYKAYETAYDAGHIFNPVLVSKVKAAKPGVIRFLDWAAANNTNVTTWATRKPVGYCFYAAQEYRASLYAGLSTLIGGVKRAVTFGSGGPTDRQTMHVTWGGTNISVSIGPNAVVTWTSHGMRVGQSFKFLAPSGSSLPAPITPVSAGDINNQTVYWVTSIVDANSFNFSATKGGANVDTTGGTLTGTPQAFACVFTQTVSLSNTSPAVVTWANHGLSIGDAFYLNSTNDNSSSYGMPSPLYNAQTLYVIAAGFGSGAFQFALTPGGTAINTGPRAVTAANNNGLLTSVGHGLQTVGFVNVAGMTGITGYNGNQLSFSVPDADHIQLQFSTSGTYSGSGGTITPTIVGLIQGTQMPMVNLNGTGNVPIVGPWGDPGGTHNDPFPGYTGTLVYESDFGVWIANAGNVGGQNGGILNHTPPEILVKFCVEVGAHPHFCLPFLALDPMTDWTTKLAEYVRDVGPAWMKPRFEPPNELWNPSLGFYATRYSWRKAPILWGSAFLFAQEQWYGKIASTAGQALNLVFGGSVHTQTKYAMMSAIQSITAGPPGGANDRRLDSQKYVAQSQPAQSGYLKDPAYNWVTHVVLANYWSSGAQDSPTETQLAYQYCVTNNGDAVAQEANIGSYLSHSDKRTTCYFTGQVSGNVLTVTNFIQPSGYLPIDIGQTIYVGSTSFTIASKLTGVGREGTYGTSATPDVGPVRMYAGGAIGVDPVGPTQSREFSLAYQRHYSSTLKAWGLSFGVDKMCGYEGGYSPDYGAPGGYPFNEHGQSIIASMTATGVPIVVTLGTMYSSGYPGTGNPGLVGVPVVLQNIGGIPALNSPNPSGVTLTNGTPGNVGFTSHGLSAGQAVVFIAQTPNSFDSTIPDQLVYGKVYYVKTVIDVNNFTVSATNGGVELAFSGTQTRGTYCIPCAVVTAVSGQTVTLNVSATGTYVANSGTLQWVGSTWNVNRFRRASKLSPQMKPLALQLMNDFVAQGGEFPSQYFIAGDSIWGALDPNIYVASSPEWDAITEFNA